MAFTLDKKNANLEMIKNFEETARKIDNFEQKEYKKSLAGKLVTSSNIQEEAKRLEEIINIVSSRVQTRNELVKDFNKTTESILDGLELIEEADDIYSYKQRYKNVKKYLDASSKTSLLSEDLKKLNDELAKKISQKQEDEEENRHLEDDLEIKFTTIYGEYLNINNITKIDLSKKLTITKNETIEALNSLKAFEIAYNTIKNAGINPEQLSKYDRDAYEFKVSYYNSKLKEIVIKVYIVILNDIDTGYEEMLLKRDRIKRIINELELVKDKYKVYEESFFNEFIEVINEQCEIIRRQSININEIKKVEEKISFKEEKLAEFNSFLKELGVRKIMVEYNILPGDEDIDFNIDSTSSFETPEEILENEQKPNQVIDVKDLNNNMNINDINKKTDIVIARVADVLGIKRNENTMVKNLSEASTDIKEKREYPIFEKATDNIFLDDKVITTTDNNIFYEMPTLPFGSEVNNYDKNGFPF